ncbi:hypothetical protein [Gracilimonas mengyeensis]|uniref:DoxX-like family protein n=1 Tax=Gracilimonas mengyeensis TaxID=1302730 RepID=A0A521EM43_9BACT|nr:hypothetical protein [Gracilimonas mengyeensis]SMO84989.1 hypothetical protein SAMN06265219_112151 [Gracilimonas mengyeensis]
MNIKDRRIHLFLQLFFLAVGIYQVITLFGIYIDGQEAQNLFEYQDSTIPFISITAALVAGISSLISCFALWVRSAWMYGFALFTSGILLSYHILKLSEAIYQNSYEIIPIVIVIIVVLQSFPYLLRRSYRSM